jgi:hypothetical protein
VRQVKVKRSGGDLEEMNQYYHRYVVAMLLGHDMDVVLAVEPVLTMRPVATSMASMRDTSANSPQLIVSSIHCT